jgi:thymidylate kinase
MKIIIIDASKSIQEIHEKIWSIISKLPILEA